MGLELPGLAIEFVDPGSRRVKVDIELNLGEAGDSISGGFAFASDLFDAATIERHRGYLLAAARALVTDASLPARRASLIGPAERLLVIETWNEACHLDPEA